MKQRLWTRNFTLLILGQICSLIGNNTLKFALSMHVLEQTGSAAAFAGMLAAAMLPTILLSPFGGILADRAGCPLRHISPDRGPHPALWAQHGRDSRTAGDAVRTGRL